MLTEFTKLMGKTPRMKVLEMMYEQRNEALAVQQIASLSGIHYNTLYLFLDDFEEHEILIRVDAQTKKNTKLYQWNESNAVSKAIALIIEGLP